MREQQGFGDSEDSEENGRSNGREYANAQSKSDNESPCGHLPEGVKQKGYSRRRVTGRQQRSCGEKHFELVTRQAPSSAWAGSAAAPGDADAALPDNFWDEWRRKRMPLPCPVALLSACHAGQLDETEQSADAVGRYVPRAVPEALAGAPQPGARDIDFEGDDRFDA